MILLEPITIFSSIPVNYSQKCNGCHQSFLNVSRFVSTCIKLDSLYNHHSHCDLQLPILCDRLKLLIFLLQCGQNNVTLPYLSSSDIMIHQAVILLFQFVLSLATCLVSFHVFHPNLSLSCATVFRQFVLLVNKPAPFSCLDFI